jgi:hypothetical protein
MHWEVFVLTTFVALYRGATVADAKMVAVSADRALVEVVAHEMLREQPSSLEKEHPDEPVLAPVREGRRRALRIIQGYRDRRNV